MIKSSKMNFSKNQYDSLHHTNYPLITKVSVALNIKPKSQL